MATSIPSVDDRTMSIGRVLERAISTIVHNPVAVLGLALVIGALPGLLMTYLVASFGLSNVRELGSNAMAGFAVAGFASAIASVAISAIVQGALTKATISESDGQKASFGECLAVGLRFFLPLIGIGIIVGFGVLLGLVLLVVPGVILLLMWAVAAPVVVVERNGVFQALRRSRELTKGARLKIFALFLVLGALYWLLSILLGYAGLEAYGETDAAMGFSVTSVLGGVVLGTIFNAFWGTVQPSLYVELRHWKEGESAEVLAEVFA